MFQTLLKVIGLVKLQTHFSLSVQDQPYVLGRLMFLHLVEGCVGNIQFWFTSYHVMLPMMKAKVK
jgi:hypothetical protein